MNQVKRWWIWLSRIGYSRGFGIQSPADYAFVRYVINEHWPYYAYEQFSHDEWLTQKLGKLFFRLANWRQPQAMRADDYQKYWQAGCKKTVFLPETDTVELALVEAGQTDEWERTGQKCNAQSVVVVKDIWRNRAFWRQVVSDRRVATTFDLYYCGIIFFDKSRYKHDYIINF